MHTARVRWCFVLSGLLLSIAFRSIPFVQEPLGANGPLAGFKPLQTPTLVPHWRYGWQRSMDGPPRSEHTTVFDQQNRRVLVYGGYSDPDTGNTVHSDLWEARPDGFLELQWRTLKTLPSGVAPSARFGHTAVYDTVNRRMIVFGGRDNNGVVDNAIFALDLRLGREEWHRLPTPEEIPGRWNHTAVYDVLGRRMIVYGGQTEDSIIDDLLILDLDTMMWTTGSVNQGPGPLTEHVAILPPTPGDRFPIDMYVYGGTDGCTTSSSLWRLTLEADGSGDWELAATTTQLGPRRNAAAEVWAYDVHILGGIDDVLQWAPHDVMLVFASHYYRQLQPNYWYSQPTLGGPPEPREGATLTKLDVDPGWMFLYYGGREETNGRVASSAWAYQVPGDPPAPPEFRTPPPTPTPARKAQITVTPWAIKCPEPSPTLQPSATPTVEAISTPDIATLTPSPSPGREATAPLSPAPSLYLPVALFQIQ
jgi:hypothetical protein